MALTDKLVAIGDAIREKNGTTELIPLADMPQAILDIVSGGGASYTSIVYNEDNTITLTDTDGTEHTMVCTYKDDGKLIGVTYDGKGIVISYEGEDLKSVGNTEVDLTQVHYTSPKLIECAVFSKMEAPMISASTILTIKESV